MKRGAWAWLLFVLMIVSTLCACSGSGAFLSYVSVTPANSAISVAGTQQFKAIAHYANGASEDVTSHVTWVSSNQAVATISTSGLATGVALGDTTISATLSNMTGSTTLTINVQLFGETFGNSTLGASVLMELDTITGAVIKTIGSTGYYLNGLAWDPSTKTLYASTSSNDPTLSNGLLIINTTTGVGTPVANVFGGVGSPVVAITVSSTGAMFGWNEGSDDLSSIDKITGLQTVVSGSGLNTSEEGMAFDATDILWYVNGGGDIYTVNTATGLLTAAGNIGQKAHHGSINPITGSYWGIDATNDGCPGGCTGVTKNILVVDLTTPAITATLPTAIDLHMIAFTK